MAKITKDKGFIDDGSGDLKVDGHITSKGHQITGLLVVSNSTRPAANSFPVGGAVWNTDDEAPNWSDGTSWRTAAGDLT